MLKKSIIFIMLLCAMTSSSLAVTFTEQDALGEWYLYELDVSPDLGPFWLYANATVTSTTDIAGIISLPDGSSQIIESGIVSISPDGSLTASFTTDTGLTGTVVDGLQDQNKSIYSYVSADTQNALGLAVGIKAGGQYQPYDMAGEWRFFGISADPTFPGLYWIEGEGSVDASGNITSGIYRGPDGTAINTTNGLLSVAPNGKLTGSIVLDNGLSLQINDGMLDVLKTFVSFVNLDSNGGLGFNIGFKKGASYLTSDLKGDWKFYNFQIDTVNGVAYWVYGIGNVDSNGTLTGSYIGPDSSAFSISNGQVSIDSSGELSGSFAIEGVANINVQSGFMDQNKTIIAFASISDTGLLDLGIGFRTSAVPFPSVTTGDLNGDGLDDLAGLTASGQIWYSTNLTNIDNIPGELSSIVTGDFNDDGNDDIAGVNSNGKVWYTTDLNSWTNIPGTVAAIVSGDLDGDGDDDIAGINPSGAISKIFYTTDLSTWTPIPGLITSITTGDLDGDGDADIVGINPDGVISKIFYTTDLTTWTPIPGLITSIVAGDFDGNGTDDIAGINPNGIVSKIFYTTDLTNWTPIPGLITSIVAGDFDGNGTDDIAGINPGGVSAKIFYTTDLSTWTSIPGVLNQITTGDLDNDGQDDLAGVNTTSNTTWYTTDLATWTNIPRTRLRAVHASPDAPNVDILVDNTVVLADVAFKEFLDYTAVQPGERNIKVNVTGTSTSVIDVTPTLSVGTDYTVIAVNFVASIEPLLLTDDNTSPTLGNARVRVVHASPDAPNVDVLVDDVVVLTNVAFKQFSDYLEVPAGARNFKVNATGTSTTVIDVTPTLTDGSVYTVVAVNDLANIEPLLLSDR